MARGTSDFKSEEWRVESGEWRVKMCGYAAVNREKRIEKRIGGRSFAAL